MKLFTVSSLYVLRYLKKIATVLGEFNAWSMDFFYLLPYETLHWHKQAHSLSKKLYFFLYTTAAVLKSSQNSSILQIMCLK